MDFEWLTFDKEILDHGYYSPKLYQAYRVGFLVNSQVYDNLLLEFYLAPGIVRDNFTRHFGLDINSVLQVRYSIRKNVELVTELDYVYEELTPTYYEVDASIGITWRF
ncbi:hypothetical protein ACNVED_16565 (plasmid) [Legionella sp. D16C41]|uniref:hypothetical protein n=1 Tax=Legionella sp. D16C41 TaxID=3402688 RepID=UPI003AF64855